MDKNKIQEVLNSKVRLDGKGEDPVIKPLFDGSLDNAPVEERIDFAAALQQLLQGQQTIQTAQTTSMEELAKLKERMVAYEKEAQAFRNDRESWYNSTINEASKRMDVSDEEKARLRKQGAEIYQMARAQARQNKTTVTKQLKKDLLAEPKVTVIDPGVPVNIKGRGIVFEPLVLNYKGIEIRLEPGIETKIPVSIKTLYDSKRRDIAHRDAIKEAMKIQDGVPKGKNQFDLDVRKANDKYNITIQRQI